MPAKNQGIAAGNALSGGFDFQCVIEAVEVIEEAGDRGEFDNLPFVEVFAEAMKERIRDVICVACQCLSELQCCAFPRDKPGQISLLKRLQLGFRRSLPPCQGGM